MSERDDRLPMHQMLDHAREPTDTIRGRTRLELRTNRLLQKALVYDVVWDTIAEDFPPLVAALERALSGEAG